MNPPPPPYLIIEPTPTTKNYLYDVWRYRELLILLAWRDIIVRYKQTFFGAAWALFRPLISTFIFVIVFSKVAHLPSMGIDYPLFVLVALLPWSFFANTVLETTPSLLNNSHLITKIYFPRMLVPIAQSVVHLLDFSIATLPLFLWGAITNTIHWSTLFSLPFWMLLMVLLTIAVSLWTSALTIKYRDVRLLVPFLIQIGMFISPIGYGSFMIPEPWQFLYSLNPIVGIIDGFRWAFFGILSPYFMINVIMSCIITGSLSLSSFYWFQQVETDFADTI